jgi:beta-lactam-binding protein with PASTA domain
MPKNKNIISLLKHIGAVILLSFLGIWLLNMWLHFYTRHDEKIEVPSLTGMRIDKAISILEEQKFRYLIIDSVYRDKLKKMDVAEQDPQAGSWVKRERTIYLTINALDKPTVQVPRLVNKSFSLACALLKNAGLNLGKVDYKKTILGDGLVVGQFFRGDSIQPYALVEKGAKIDLIVSIKPEEGDEFDENGNIIIREFNDEDNY